MNIQSMSLPTFALAQALWQISLPPGSQEAN
jgi:hypothetical protein